MKELREVVSSDDDIYLFNEGNHFRLYEKMGAHLVQNNGVMGVHFSVWAPDAQAVSVVGDFNEWSRHKNPLSPQKNSGIWAGFVPGVKKGAYYKFHISSRHNGYEVDKADPYGMFHETPPKTASVVWDLDYRWGDGDWIKTRGNKQGLGAPVSIYEVHLGSWMRNPKEPHSFLTYRDLAPKLVDYALRMGFTHVEFLPVMEHPFYGSWGYQVTGYFAPTSRMGTPQDFMYLIDTLHQNGIGVILDWVPAHFPNDEHGLAFFDGTHLYEHKDPRLGFHPDWKSAIFNYGRNEVRSFLLSSAMFWLDKYHADGLRVDGVASMLYRDYSRKEGEWLPNEQGGRENLEAVSLLRKMNEVVYANYPGVQTMAEESTAWPMVSRPTDHGGLGFGFKWDMGFVHDALKYVSRDPVHRKHHQNEITFRMIYAFTENYVLPLSHDEMVHGKRALVQKMPGDWWQRCANLRMLLAYTFAQPGKKLLFMGSEFATWREWNHDESLDWHLADIPDHAGVQRFVTDLNRLYREQTAMHELDCEPAGFEWIDANDADQSVLSFLRKDKSGNFVVVACNLTPVPRLSYRIGVPASGFYRELLNSDASIYGGSGMGNLGRVQADGEGAHGRPASLVLTLPPLSVLYLQRESR